MKTMNKTKEWLIEKLARFNFENYSSYGVIQKTKWENTTDFVRLRYINQAREAVKAMRLIGED